MSKLLSVLIAGLFAASTAIAAEQKSEPSKAAPATPAAASTDKKDTKATDKKDAKATEKAKDKK